MHYFDSATLLLCLCLVALLAARATPHGSAGFWLRGLSAALIASVAGHLIFEGFRWQMAPAYLVTVSILIIAGARLLRPDSSRSSSRIAQIGRWSGASVAVLLVASTTLASLAFPVFEVPEPRGPHPVGTLELHLIDTERPAAYAGAGSEHRELMVRVWYPADTFEGNQRAMYWRHAADRSAAVTASTPLPWFTFTHLGLVPTHSYWDAPIAQQNPTYPVVLYSHGIGIGWASANTKLAEGLASQGYIVVGINHASIGSVSVFPDGRITRFDDETARAMNQPPPQEAREMQAEFSTTDDWQVQVDLYGKAMTFMGDTLEHVTRALQVQVADQQFVMRHLQQMQRDNVTPLASRLDLTRIGIVGMSLGGSAAFETCSIDERCKAGVNLDGFHPRHIGVALASAPFLFVNRADNLLYNTNFQNARSRVYSVVISGVTHFNFFDFAIMSPLYKRLGVLGSLDGERGLNIVEDHVVAFFDVHLRDRANAQLAPDAQRHPEVSFAQRN